MKYFAFICSTKNRQNISIFILVSTINPFVLNGISHSSQLDQSISILRVIGWYFSFFSNFNRTFCKQTVETLIRRHIMRRLIWVCTVFLCPTKRTLGLYGLKSKEQNSNTFQGLSIDSIILPASLLSRSTLCSNTFQP